MLTETKLRAILRRLPRLTIGIVGDFFLDRYLDLDPRLTEKSVETGLDAYQVTGVRVSPGAAGTVVNNLAALGVGRMIAFTILGDDGEGYELRRELAARRVDLRSLIVTRDRRTPTYTKPMLGGGRGDELNRMDIKNRSATPLQLSKKIAMHLRREFHALDALIVADQVQEANCGVITAAVRHELAALGRRHPDKLILADSRSRIGLFRNLTLKPNRDECLGAARSKDARAAAMSLSQRCGRHVFCTLGDRGILVADGSKVHLAKGIRVRGPMDIVGAGDSATAGIVCALAAGATLLEAAALGNIVASITIQKIGTTGTATPSEVLQRFRESAA